MEVDGQVVRRPEPEELTELRGRIGYVFQFAALFDSMTVAENIALGLAKQGPRITTPSPSGWRRASAWWNCSGTEDRYPAELSRRHAQAGGHRAGDRAQAALHSL